LTAPRSSSADEALRDARRWAMLAYDSCASLVRLLPTGAVVTADLRQTIEAALEQVRAVRHRLDDHKHASREAEAKGKKR
jgi:hypothetical protein